jgi:beta-mannosidase
MRLILLTIFLILVYMPAETQTAAVPLRHPLRADWFFRKANAGEWLPTSVPVSIHTALLAAKQIEDPFYGTNEENLRWIEREDWEFRCAFDVPEQLLERKHVEMVFRGVDTYAFIFLNDSLILETENMFRTWRAEVKHLLKPAGNELRVYFESPIKKVEPAWQALGYELPGGIRTLTRKAQFHYGWDWGPRFVGCGLLRAPELLAWDDFLLENVFIRPQRISEQEAVMTAHFRYRSDVPMQVDLSLTEGRRKTVESRTLEAGVGEDSVVFNILNPRLWWCLGMGEPHLYDFTLDVKQGYRLLEQRRVRTGIRTIELVTEPDAHGQPFYFRLNGKPVFAKGANYIPMDIFQDRVTPEHYRRLLDDVVAANMNMLRVWGGGIYEEEVFYEMCDARGILVWQDFMYACAMYPASGRFLKNAAAEAIEQIERLRQHPCIALWCGNNENSEGWHHWGWQMAFTEAQRSQIWRDYEILFKDLLPTYVANYGGGVPYWESSPKYGRSHPKALREGDAHYWGVWHDEEPFEVFNRKVPRFMSEFGFQAFPDWATIEAFSRPEDRFLESKVMLAHQKHPRGNALIAEYLRRDFRLPSSFEDFVYVSQLLQAEGMRIGIEAHRRNKPYCRGTLYWQLNDVWPVASWSSIDYYGRWKALHYYVREAYRPVVALPLVEKGSLKVFAAADIPNDSVVVDLYVRAMTFSGKLLGEIRVPKAVLTPDSARLLWEGSVRELLHRRKEEEAVADIQLLDPAGNPLHRRLYYFVAPKKLLLPPPRIALSVAPAEKGYRLELESPVLVKSVYLSAGAPGRFSDNYFDVLPGERRVVLFETQHIFDNPQEAFRIKHLQQLQPGRRSSCLFCWLRAH